MAPSAPHPAPPTHCLATRSRLVLGGIILTLGLGSAALASPASAGTGIVKGPDRVSRGQQPAPLSPPQGYGAGAAFCNQSNHGGVSTSGVAFDNVYPCANPNISDVFGYQCVEYSVRFEWAVYGEPIGSLSSAAGRNVVSILHSQDGVSIQGEGPGNLPRPGSVISMWGNSNQDWVGHTGVVAAVNAPGGNGTITVYDENGALSGSKSTGVATIYVNNWDLSVHWNPPYHYTQFNWTTQTQPNNAGPVVLGSKRFTGPNGKGFGTAHPSLINNGGDASGVVENINWTHWGSKESLATGRTYIFKPHGGYYNRSVRARLKASARGHCGNSHRRAYRKLYVRVPKKPGGKLGPWRSWSGSKTICKSPY